MFGIFQIEHFLNFPNLKFSEFSGLEILKIFQTENFGNYQARNFYNFHNWTCLEFSKLDIF